MKWIQAFIILGMIFFVASSSRADDQRETVNEYAKAKKFDFPLRKISVIVSDEGYYPDVISVFRGELIKLYATSIIKQPSCLIVSEKKLFLAVKKGEISEGELFFDLPGTYKFYCPTGKIKGKIVVLEKKKKMKSKRTRRIASEVKKKGYWMPREF